MKMKKILLTLMCLALALAAVSASAETAREKGVFGQLVELGFDGSRLSRLETAAEPLEGCSLTTRDGISLQITQALYEGDRVFIAYRMDGLAIPAELNEGAPEEEYEWVVTEEDIVPKDDYDTENPEIRKAFDWLDGSGQRWVSFRNAGMSDGIDLENGDYADIFDGEEIFLADGTVLGWKECVIPAQDIADTVCFHVNLFCSRNVLFQDGTTLYTWFGDEDETGLQFTLSRKNDFEILQGSAENTVWQARAELKQGLVDLKGTVRVHAPSMVRKWEDWDEEDPTDIIMGWVLYRGETFLADDVTWSIDTEGGDTLVFGLVLPRMDSLEGLRLVPEYGDGGPKVEEAFGITVVK